ncbi:twin-arginine translocase subunit TatC [Thiocystis violascens]|uniref:Sec-independent protein translocase protein TatC n=1 Tax=Thiocystis violascens (strain ATCC 17096 / DSM 198 / 6111) TaxID=765911 RepID=I3YA58_THIV6|nr:twin-arginine translocase subunit TatC [Thiocystis violascens]AFL73876.1 twin arginine targeting protein translocase subunit TatC [Thiocystis violascens DSM 198]
MSSAIPPDDPGAEQPFISHLAELRDRLIRMLIAIGVVILLLFPFANDIYTYIAGPLIAQLPEGNTMIATQVISPFLTPFKLALVAAVFLAMPYLLYQLWAFVAPGLYQHEQRLAIPLLVSSILLFYLGMAFAYYVVFPLVFAFMAGTTPEGVAMMTDIAAYLDFVLALFFAFGLAFEIPVATILLVAVGAVTPETLVQKRPYVIVGAFIIGMLLTPPDVISQTMLALPMWLLFELGIIFSRLLLRQRGNRGEGADSTPPPPGGGALSSSFAGSKTARNAPARTSTGKTVAGSEIGRDLAGDVDDPDRWRPMTDEEMEVELDLLDADQAHASQSQKEKAPNSSTGAINSVEEKILRANRLRDLSNDFAARQILYEVLEEGDADQRRVARNILQQLDNT